MPPPDLGMVSMLTLAFNWMTLSTTAYIFKKWTGNTHPHLYLAFFAHRNYINVEIKQPSRQAEGEKTAMLTISILLMYTGR